MKCFHVSVILMVVVEKMLLAAVISGVNYFTNGQEVEENLITSRRRTIYNHDHKTDSAYNGILDDDDDDDYDEINPKKLLEPHEMKARIKVILENMDKNNNNIIEKDELSTKLLETYKRLSEKESDEEFETSDLDEDGYITWNEYISDTYASDIDIEENETTKNEKLIFLAADLNKDDKLDKIEFRYFYTPEDYPHMKLVMMKDVVSRFDTNEDGKITFDEFIKDSLPEHNEKWIQNHRFKYTELDINKDGILDEDEVYKWSSPDNELMADTEAAELIVRSDTNKDGILSFEEVLENYFSFISPESDGYYLFKDEL